MVGSNLCVLWSLGSEAWVARRLACGGGGDFARGRERRPRAVADPQFRLGSVPNVVAGVEASLTRAEWAQFRPPTSRSSRLRLRLTSLSTTLVRHRVVKHRAARRTGATVQGHPWGAAHARAAAAALRCGQYGWQSPTADPQS